MNRVYLINSKWIDLLEFRCQDASNLFDPFDDMETRISFSDVRYFADIQAECNVLKCLLHLTASEWAQIAAALGRTAIWVLLRQFG